MDPQMTALVLCLFAASVLGTYGLEFHLDNSYVCGPLVCKADADLSNHTIQTIIELSILDTTYASPEVKLASISVLESEVYVDDAIKNNINVEGNISDYYANLQIGFKNQSYCMSGSFMCQLTYVNHGGHVDNMESPEIHPKANDTSSSGSTSDVINAMGTLETKVDVIEQELKNLTSLLTEVLADNQGNNQGNLASIGTLDDCYKGMTNVIGSNRTLITVPGFGEALCDTTTDGGGWVVFQRRADGNINFIRNWVEYRSGFGNVLAGEEYWLGLEAIHALTLLRNTELRIDLKSNHSVDLDYYAVYSSFDVSDEADNYRLTVGDFTGNVGDYLYYQNDTFFTTHDVDNDRYNDSNCAHVYDGGWWYNDCGTVRLNSMYTGSYDYDFKGIYWSGVPQPITWTEMKLRFNT